VPGRLRTGTDLRPAISGYPLKQSEPFLIVVQAGLWEAGLEELDGIPGGVLDQDLPAANPDDAVVAEVDPFFAQHLHAGAKIGDFKGEPGPSPGMGLGAIRHRLPAATLAAWRAGYQTKVAASQHGEGWGWMHLFVDVQIPAVEGDCGVDVVDHATDADGGHTQTLLWRGEG
jgi:hypothetical protein